MIHKRDPEKRKYLEYKIPPERNCPLICDEMNEKVNCTSCWNILEFWKTYTSLQIHHDYWFWYPVCAKCYNIELQQKLLHPQK